MDKISFSKNLTRSVNLPADGGPLGIQVTPYCSSLSGRMLGLLITNIEEHSRTKTENIFQEDECIVQINGVQLQDKAFADSQEVFREALLSPSMQLEVVPVSNKSAYEKGLIGQLFNGDGKAKSPSLARAKVELKPNRQNMAAAESPEPLHPNPTSSVPYIAPSNRGKMELGPDRAPTRQNAAVEIPEPLQPNPTLNVPSIAPSNRGKTELRPDRAVTWQNTAAAEIPEPLHPNPTSNVPSIAPSNRGKTELRPDRAVTWQNTAAAEIPEPLHPYPTSSVPSIAPSTRGKTEPRPDRVPTRQNTAAEIPEPLQPNPTSNAPSAGAREQSPSAALGRADLPSKKGGKRIKIDLTKGAEGLGFTVVTRDSVASWPGPILVKNILPRGAAVKDGRLQPGDRILEVNGMDMSGRSQEELVAMLRSTKHGESVCVTVSRQEDVFLPREMKGEDGGGGGGNLALEDGRERLTYEIPLNETPSAGLGVSLKGNKSRETGEDLGIFIKSVIHGGAAHKDGRLRVNDQLIAVNGEALLGRSNHAAMDTLRRSMSAEGNGRGSVRLVLLRSSAPEGPSDAVNAAIERATRQRPPANQGDSGPAHFYAPHDKYGRDDSLVNHRDDFFPNGQSKSMDLVMDEGNVRSLAGHQRGPTNDGDGGTLGPTLGLWKSSSLESLQSAISEVRQNERVPFHRPRPQVVRGRGCNQSFRIAIDKSYEGPSEDDDDDHSEQSSGRETPASGSSRQDLDVEDGKKPKAANGRKREKKSKGKKRREDGAEDAEKKSRKKGFGLLRFGKKKEDRSKDATAAKMARQHLDACLEEEVDGFLDDRDRDDPRYARVEASPRYALTDSGPRSLPNLREDEREPNYAQIEHYRQPDSLPPIGRDDSPGKGRTPRAAAPDDLEALYAKVNKPRQSAESDGQPIATRREYPPPARAAPAYEELDSATRRFLDDDPHRVFARGAESRPLHLYEELDRPHGGRDHPRPTRRDPLPYQEHERSRASSSDRLGRRRYETVADISRYGDATPPEPRRKNPVIGAV
ncbi:par-3 family cell polarity regulator beta a isoform X2 [Stigmatopora argus]